jgi:hypothetical protein
MSNLPTKALLIALAAIAPTILLAGRADALCRCKSVYKQGYGMVWLCCDANGMCSYYEQPNYSC